MTGTGTGPGLVELCRAMFERHRVEAFGGVFHVPDMARYPALFAWDSGYHALATRHFAPELAIAELTTLYRANSLPDGLLSHERSVPGAEQHRALIEGLFGPMFEGDRTPFIDPPTAAFAAARLSRTLGPRADALLHAALGHLRAIAAHRTLGAGALPVALHPFETGTEGSALMHGLLPGSLGESLDRLKELTVTAVGAEMSPEAALANGHGFVVHDPATCGWYLLALEEVVSACRAQGRAADANWAEDTATAVADELEQLAWWDGGDIFAAYDLAGGRRIDGVSASGLIPAASRTFARRGFSRRVADRHVRAGAPMWGPRGFAAGVVQPGAGVSAFVQWDGNAVWGATAYWAQLVVARIGRWVEARRLCRELEQLVLTHGFREFYDAWSSEPGGAGAEAGFTWPALVLEMANTVGLHTGEFR